MIWKELQMKGLRNGECPTIVSLFLTIAQLSSTDYTPVSYLIYLIYHKYYIFGLAKLWNRVKHHLMMDITMPIVEVILYRLTHL